MSRAAAFLIATALFATGCTSANGEADPAPAAGTTVGSASAAVTIPPVSTVPPTTFTATSSTGPPPLLAAAPATCAVPVSAAAIPGQVDPPDGSTTTTRPLQPSAQAALEGLRTDPRIAGATLSVSVWIDGLGEVAIADPDTALVPASNQKLVTALGALRLLDPQERLRTDLVATGPIVDGVLQGDLVVVGGGDPTLARQGEHSLESFVTAVTAAGIHSITGRVLVDDSRYDDVRTAPGWPEDWARWVGSLSAFVADHNQYRKDAPFLADPALGHAALFQYALTAAGVTVSSEVAHGAALTGMRLASLESPTINELVTIMLLRSDNLFAELLIKEIGARAAGVPGSTAAGLAAVRSVLAQLCGVTITGVDADGSGLSRGNTRSARELRRLLLAAQLQPWGALFVSDLSVAGAPDRMGGRLIGPRTTNNVRAKGGSLTNVRSLSGYLTTASGRNVVFSVIVNGGSLGRAEPAIDDFITDLASLVT